VLALLEFELLTDDAANLAHRFWKCIAIIAPRHPIGPVTETHNHESGNGRSRTFARKLSYR